MGSEFCEATMKCGAHFKVVAVGFGPIKAQATEEHRYTELEIKTKKQNNRGRIKEVGGLREKGRGRRKQQGGNRRTERK